ncbi:hypothetical protein HK103_006507 [Boothiomyces macroporosus]|uniref:Matrin-type domain-containing protein n=1 Tax=Boothiomyces macroporosus TaxID=261099 RepID=A0AAD5ULD8_9FUNG|nr:hypothetical protein HK103_006507 [Boothiomyces macroporosus]
MDFQNRVGSRFGGGGVADASQQNLDRKERLRRLALETIDLSKDPYLMKNHVGTFECKLCLTIHANEGSYLAHTQGKKHSTNLQRRMAKDQKDIALGGGVAPLVFQHAAAPTMMYTRMPIRKVHVKIGRPGYKVTKIRDPETNQNGLLFQIYYPDIVNGIKPRYRFMSAYEQRQEPPSKFYQYLLIAAEPYETIAFKIQSLEIDKNNLWSFWDLDCKQYHFQFFFKIKEQ